MLICHNVLWNIVVAVTVDVVAVLPVVFLITATAVIAFILNMEKKLLLKKNYISTYSRTLILIRKLFVVHCFSFRLIYLSQLLVGLPF